jgi:uncharacterized protein YcsI (UPF0317 family)
MSKTPDRDSAMVGRSRNPAHEEARRFRMTVRAGEHTGHTAGRAPGGVQGNVVVLPANDAGDFLRFCQRNPKPCPLLAVSEPGDPALPPLGENIDIRTDVPQYRIFEHGAAAGDVTDIRDLWRDDLVAFVLGCSFSFEEALIQAGVRLRHLEEGREVAMYRTSIPTRPAGRFHGPMVASMRPLTPRDAIRAIQITSRFPQVHGAPVHFGDPGAIGIDDLERPDYGEHTPFLADEVPVFWACGVTPQAVVQEAQPAFCITHKPGHMLVTDLLNAELTAM